MAVALTVTATVTARTHPTGAGPAHGSSGPGKLTVSGNQLLEDGSPIVLHGINWFGEYLLSVSRTTVASSFTLTALATSKACFVGRWSSRCGVVVWGWAADHMHLATTVPQARSTSRSPGE